MADDADITADRDEAEMPLRLAMSRRDSGRGPAANGHCHFCGTPVAPSLHYCDTDCAADHARALRAKERNRT